MTLTEMQSVISEAQGGIENASSLMRQATSRIHELETALKSMVLLVERTIIDTDGRYPSMDMGCIGCTNGAVPNAKNTGLCPLHAAKRLLGIL